MTHCPTCHQYILSERGGVHMPPLLARLFDLIKATGTVGASAEELHYDLYRGYERPRQRCIVKSHVWRLRELLEGTDWRLVTGGRGALSRWYLRRSL